MGAAFLFGSATDSAARSTSIVIGVVYGLVAILGLLNVAFVVDLLSINFADNLLHLGTALLALYFGLAGKTGTVAAA
ncbi:MAG: DUF4383 domain-containing protein [Actinobacteria bacterium]|nr:DUF4383 domain-containing protein [Actinomycetota bacterium]